MTVQVDSSVEAEPEPFGKFLLLRPIRKGGVGLLSLAFDTEARRVVVLKRLHPSQRGGDSATRFQDEIQVSFRLSHPNLVKAVEASRVGDEAYLALEWIPGQDLDSFVERARRFDQRPPLPVAAAIIRQVCRALEYAHAQSGFVHRDISASNIVVAYDGAVRLVDFGFALWELKSSKTIPGLAPGTLGFLAPEQREGQRVDARADLFSLGAVFQFLLTGLAAFGKGEDGNSKDALRMRLAEQRVELPPALLTFLWRTMQANPNNRFESAAQIGAEIERALGQPLAAEAEIGKLVSELFPVEKKMAADELAGWQRRLGVERAQQTAIVSRAKVGLGQEAEDAPAVPRNRMGLVIAGALAVACIVACGAWLLLRRETPQPAPHVVRTAPPAAPPSPAAAPAPPAAAVAPSPPAHVLPAPAPAPAPAHAPPAAAPHVASPHAAPAAQQAKTVEPAQPPPVRPTLDAAQTRFKEAESLVRSGEVQAARAIFDELVQDARVRPQVKLSLAELDYKAGHYDRAAVNASDAIKLGVGARAYFIRAISKLRAGQPEDAARDFNQVLAVEPDNEDAKDGLERARAQMSRGKNP